MNARRTNECPPVAATTEGAGIAMGANAGTHYAPDSAVGKPGMTAAKSRLEKRGRHDAARCRSTAYRASTGQIWAFIGKRGRVLSMLATMGQGVTQWDCLPWHTRLGASIHAMREEGLSIETVREGDYRHARYFLRTPGCLLIQAENSGEPVMMHREVP